MSIVRKTGEERDHKLDQQTDAGDFLVVCGDLIKKNFAIVSSDAAGTVNCPGCLVGRQTQLTAPATGRVPKHYRRPKSAHREAKESLKFAHVEIVAALEWLQRGGEKQFIETAMDRALLGYRFLRDMLREHGGDRLEQLDLDSALIDDEDEDDEH